MGLVLDEPQDSDIVFHRDGFDIIVDKTLWEAVQGITIDARYNQWIGTELVVKPTKLTALVPTAPCR